MSFFGELLEAVYRSGESTKNFLSNFSPIVKSLGAEYTDTRTGTTGGGWGKYLGGALGGIAGTALGGRYGGAAGASLGYSLTQSLTGDTIQQPNRDIYRDLRSSQAQVELQNDMIARGNWRSTAKSYVQNILDQYTTQSKQRGYDGRY